MEQTRLTYTVRELAEKLNLGVNATYYLVNSKGFPCICVGKKKLIPISGLNRWLDNQVN